MAYDVRINKDVGLNDEERSGREEITKTLILPVGEKKLPSWIVTVAQFLGIHIYNINVMLLHMAFPGCLFHATSEELHLDGSTFHNAWLSISVSLISASFKVIKHVGEEERKVQPCLSDVSFGLKMEATLASRGPIAVENLQFNIHQPTAVVSEGLFNLFKVGNKLRSKRVPSQDITSSSLIQHFHNIQAFLPKVFEFNMDETTLKVYGTQSFLNAKARLRLLHINMDLNVSNVPENLPLFSMTISFKDMDASCCKEKVLGFQELTWTTKLEDTVLSINLATHALIMEYRHVEVQNWLRILVSQPLIMKEPMPLLQVDVKNEDNIFSQLLAKVTLKSSVEFWNVNVNCTLQECLPLNVVFTYSKFSFESVHDEPGYAGEILLETLICDLGPIHDTSTIKKQHCWGCPLYLALILIKFKSIGIGPLRSQAMIDTARFEWSQKLDVFLKHGIRCIKYYSKLKTASSQTTNKTAQIKSLLQALCVNISLSNINGFILSNNGPCLMLRLDSSSVETQGKDIVTCIEGAKAAVFNTNSPSHQCGKASEIKHASLYFHYVRVKSKLEAKQLDIELPGEAYIVWSPLLHLQVLQMIEELQESILNIRPRLNITDDVPAQLSKRWLFQVHLKARMSFSVVLSCDHRVELIIDDLKVNRNDQGTKWQSHDAKVKMNGHEIMKVEGIHLETYLQSDLLRIEREVAKNLSLSANRVWTAAIHHFRLRFPYGYHFAEAFNEKFMSVYKWLKVVHKKTKKAFTVESPLPPDLLIKIKHFSMQLDDDKFEVKLRDNYELLEDEYHESLKRQKMMDGKVEELRKTHLLMPAGKVDELYSNLNKKNADIYIQRSKQMYKASPMRTHLFLWNMEDVEIAVLADTSFHGKENVMRVMEEIDADSPWPEEDVNFSTLWCRWLQASFKVWKVQLRDFPQPLLDIREMHTWGTLLGAEQEAPKRSRRQCVVMIGEPLEDVVIERGMTSLKFYHDLSFDVEHFSFAFGPCWEPVISQCNLGFDKLNLPSKDPSPPMPFWDKMRLLFHGRMTMSIQQLSMFLHASLDPYNSTEEMEVTWRDLVLDWINGKFVLKGDLSVYCRTATKYDDCRLLHLPNVKLTIKIDWQCQGDPFDHHSVLPCAPDKLPEYSSNQQHDSFRAFRSQNMNISVSLETKPVGNQQDVGIPTVLLYGSTLRWFENLKLILSGVTRPTRRGVLFKNVKPRKPSLSRHYHKVRLSASFHRFHVCYWMSFSMQKGFELNGGRLSSSSEHVLTLVPIDDGLKHRPRADWSIAYMNSELNDVLIWLKSALQDELNGSLLHQPVEKYYFLSVARVSYGRETFVRETHPPVPLPNATSGATPGAVSSDKRDTPTHRLVVHDLKGAWTKSNRDVAFALFDSFVKSQQLKKNLSTAALKGYRVDNSMSPQKNRTRTDNVASPPNAVNTAGSQTTPSPITKIQTGHVTNMLQKLIAEADNNSVVFSEDLSTPSREEHLQGVPACQTDDVVHKNWLIELVNSQVLLKGCETKGYVILSSAKAQILQRIHRPVWRDHSLVSKTTWVGCLECMQYYATVNAGESDSVYESIMWLTVDNIQEKDSLVISDLPDLVGSGQSVGGVVSETVGAADDGENPTVQLQRIASRCKCEFFYVSYGETSLDPSVWSESVPLASDSFVDSGEIWEKQRSPVDAFTLMHHDLNVCTNSLQYAMILDIVNNLLLYVEPQRKEASERLQRMRFQLQLFSVEDQRKPIQQLQSHVRSLASQQRRLEKEMYLVQRALADDQSNESLLQEACALEQQANDCKEQLTARAEELNAMISCFKETQISASQLLERSTNRGDSKPVTVVRANEICFKHAQWRLTETDGQLGIADLVLSNFLYTKKSKSDDSVEHLLELGYINMTNLMPNQIYKAVLSPTEIQSHMPVDRQRSLRVFCREKAPVGGISVKEHFEINVVPITIGITYHFFKIMLKFCFPEKDSDTIDDDVENHESTGKKKGGHRVKRKESNFYVRIEEKDDLEKMKERAAMNKLFIYIKIPEVPVRVSYKGEKDKNIEDVNDFSLVIPTLEYHNVTWTWLDLLLGMKNDSKRVLLSQVIKQKLQIKSSNKSQSGGPSEDGPSPQEEDKARILLGSKLTGTLKLPKKSLFKPK